MIIIWIILFMFFINYNYQTFEREYKCILLVTSSNLEEVYKEARPIWKKYMNTNPNVKVLFVYGENTAIGIDRTDEDLIYDVYDTYDGPGYLQKTIKALEFIDKNFKYDYVIRTNSTTFWDFTNLCKKLDNLPNKNLYYGSVASNYGVSFVGGSCILLTPDIVKIILHNQNQINFDLKFEDVILGGFLQSLNIHGTNHTTSSEIIILSEIPKIEDIKNYESNGTLYYKIKCNDRTNDRLVQEELLRYFFPDLI